MKKYLFVALTLIWSTSVFAQKKTTAYILEDYIFEKYDGIKKLNDEVQKKQDAFETEFNKIALEYQTANLAYQESLKNISVETTESLNSKLKSVQEIKQSAENYQKETEKQLQEFVGTRIFEIKEEIKKTTEKVAKEKGVIYVFTRNRTDTPMNFSRVVLFTDETKTLNLSDDVLKILNASVK